MRMKVYLKRRTETLDGRSSGRAPGGGDVHHWLCVGRGGGGEGDAHHSP